MHDLGYIVYYGKDEHLKDDVVLQPQWLTKAIGFVLEDRTTNKMAGILPDSRLREVWFDHPFENEPKYDPKFYPFFLRLMEKYDVSYRLEEGNASLVAQHVPQVRPALPWLPEAAPRPGLRRLAMVCVMEEEPPGLVPWMIVRTHDYAYDRSGANGQRLHWQKGMFLRYEGHGEAMLEQRGREFHVYSEGSWPDFFINVLRWILHKLITDNWPGLEGRYYFAVPCREKANGKACEGRFDIEALSQFKEEGDETIRCQVCRTRQNIVQLLYGFEKEDSRQQLDRIETKLDLGFTELLATVEGLESQIANSMMVIMKAIASEAKEGPRLFTIEPVAGNWNRWIDEKYRLHLWCEAEDCQHKVREAGKGVYEFKMTKEWVQRVAPYVKLVATMLKTVLPVAGPAANLLFDAETMKGVKNQLDLMKGISGALTGLKVAEPFRERRGILTEPERSGVRALHAFLREQDPLYEKLGLHRIPTYTGDYRWLCKTHYDQTQSKYLDTIE